jgi:uncharacterized protein
MLEPTRGHLAGRLTAIDVVISGASGLIGSALAARLEHDGHRVVRLVRPDTASRGADTIAWDPSAGTIDAAGLDGVDAVVHLAGASIADKRWTDERKREIRDSRLQGTSVLTSALAKLSTPPAVLVSGSAVGYYGDASDRELTERSPAGTGFLAEMVADWEAAAQPAVDAGIRTVFVRAAPVLSLEGGLMKYMLTLFRFGLGARFGDGSQWFPWITIDDEVASLLFAIDKEQLRGPVNAAAPGAVTNRTFTKTLGRVLHRPTPWWAPVPVLEILAGKERAQEALMASAKVVPAALLDADFTFSDPELEPALRRILSEAHTR